jgi:ABC-type transport system substrate-binding protein/tetratricopeptide (TPR) repeat protein
MRGPARHCFCEAVAHCDPTSGVGEKRGLCRSYGPPGSPPARSAGIGRQDLAGILPRVRAISKALALAVAMVALSRGGRLAAEERLFEQDPFDQITLNKANQGAVLKVKPLELPGRRLPERLPRRGVLRVRLLDDPGKLYELPWQAIDKVELFEQLVLQKAVALVAAKEFDQAYDYFKFLEEKHAGLPGLAEAMEEYLFQEAEALYLKKQYDGALALLRELYRRNPQRPKLDTVLGAATEKLVEQYVAEEKYRAARALLRNLAAWFPQHPVVAKYENELKQRAAALSAEARSAMQEGDLRRAAQLTDRVIDVWPALSGARELAESIHQKYPRVVVGVSLPTADPEPGRLDDWAARRSARLVYRTLTEFMGPGSEGGKYGCPVGEMTIEALERRITVQIRPDVRWSSGEAALTGYDVSRRLLAMADPRDAAYRAGWAEVFGGVAVADVYQVEVQMRLAHVRPDALLQTILPPYTSPAATNATKASLRCPSVPGGPPLGNGPYVVGSRTAQETRYLANARYFAAQRAQPQEIVERYYARGSRAIQALRDGRIDVLDRLNPWSVEAVRRDENLVVEPYAMPLVHCLVPNMRRPLTAHPALRRALVYGIHREAILNQLLGGAEAPGCQVLSGPFPARLSLDDPISYARDPGIESRAYEPRLAMALAELSRKEVAAAQKQTAPQHEKPQPPAKMPRLVLAYPPHQLARLACTSIQRQLELVGIPVELRELSGPLPEHIPEDVDLLYAELAMWEPLVDAPRLLGADGMAGGCSPYMSLALRQLRQAADWQQVRKILYRIDRLAHDEVDVVPLWQLTEHFAYRKGLQGIGTRPVTLYQNVEQWQCAFQYQGDGG